MAWIEAVSYSQSSGRLRKIYDRIKTKDDYLDSILTIHGQRPHTLEGHMSLYKSVLHHPGNTLPRWWLETIGLFTSLLNQCDYCVSHHFTGLEGLLNNPKKAQAIKQALVAGEFTPVFNAQQQATLSYARQLTLQPNQVKSDLITAMKDTGTSEGAILEINQVVSYFCYANRTVLGLGVTTEEDILGLSPGNKEETGNWQHI